MRTTVGTDVGGKIGWVEDKDGVEGVFKLGNEVAIIGLAAFYSCEVAIGVVGRLGYFSIKAVFGEGLECGCVFAAKEEVGG